MNKLVAPMKQLTKSATTSDTDFKNRTKSYEEILKAEPAAGRQTRTSVKNAHVGPPVMEVELEKIKDVPSTVYDNLDRVRLGWPLLLTNAASLLVQHSDYQELFKSFSAKFDAEFMKKGKAGRVSKDVLPVDKRDSVGMAWYKALSPAEKLIFADLKFVHMQEKKYGSLLSPTFFATSGNFETTSNEKSYVGSLRIHDVGHNKLMLVDFVTYKDFYTSTFTTPSPSIPDKDVCTHFRNAGPKVIEAFLEFSKDKGGDFSEQRSDAWTAFGCLLAICSAR